MPADASFVEMLESDITREPALSGCELVDHTKRDLLLAGLGIGSEIAPAHMAPIDVLIIGLIFCRHPGGQGRCQGDVLRECVRSGRGKGCVSDVRSHICPDAGAVSRRHRRWSGSTPGAAFMMVCQELSS